MDCNICRHKEHEAGQCKQCNCGESTMVNPKSRGNSPNLSYSEFIQQQYNRADTVRWASGHYRSRANRLAKAA